MPRDLILGTAGHIDHGKTTLVRALTGVDCDRLPEEKQRGITIDLGYAQLELGTVRLGIVDVPGHEKFIRNMLAGASGFDLALLVIAADDGVMPQTREHLEILQLLELRHGIIALTKVDLIDDGMLELVIEEVRELVADSFLAEAPILPTAAPTGHGIAELGSHLEALCQQIQRTPVVFPFRMPIDRSFVVQGHGTVVTGTVLAGQVQLGDEIEWLPSKERVRVRGLQQHGQTVEQVERGQRAAVNLAGVEQEAIARGQELAAPGSLQPSRVLTVRLYCLPDHERGLKHRLGVHVHLGTGVTLGTLSLLDADRLPPGDWGIAQIFLADPVTATWRQPFVIRDAAAVHTLGGGQVLQPSANKLRRRALDSIEQIEALPSNDPLRRVEAVAWLAGFGGITPTDLPRLAGIPPGEAAAVLDALVDAGRLEGLSNIAGKPLLLHRERLGELKERVLATLATLHAEYPLLTRHERGRVLARLDYLDAPELLQAVLDRLRSAGQLVGDSQRVARADFQPKLSNNQRKLKDKIVVAYQQGGFQPPMPSDFAGQPGGQGTSLVELFEVCLAEGHLVRIAEEVYLHVEHATELSQRIQTQLGPDQGVTVAEIRDLLGTSRKFAVPICEYLDRIGLTRREGDLRFLAQVPPLKTKS